MSRARSATIIVVYVAVAAAAVGACGSDELIGGIALVPCTEASDCPADWSCSAGYCQLLRGGTDATDGPDAVDTSVPEPDVRDAGTDTAADVHEDVSEDDALWLEFGTRGSVTGLVNTRAECDSRSVRTDDLSRSELPDIGPSPWGAVPIEDETGFCGSASETLGWRLLNCERITRGLDPVRCDLRLVWIARQHSANMRDVGFFDHLDPEGRTPWDRMEANGVTGWSLVGENISTYPDAESEHLTWMESEGHRENILTPEFAWVGQGDTGGPPMYATQLFARYFSDR